MIRVGASRLKHQSVGDGGRSVEPVHNHASISDRLGNWVKVAQAQFSPSSGAPTFSNMRRKTRTSGALLDQREVARLLKVKERCIENWRHRGFGPAFIKVSSRMVRYRVEDLSLWIETMRRVPPGAEGRI
jgi:hypothetical protein